MTLLFFFLQLIKRGVMSDIQGDTKSHNISFLPKTKIFLAEKPFDRALFGKLLKSPLTKYI